MRINKISWFTDKKQKGRVSAAEMNLLEFVYLIVIRLRLRKGYD